MSAIKQYMEFCRDHDLNPRSPRALHAYHTGATEITIKDDRPLAMDDIDALTGGLVGSSQVRCPYCGIPGKANMKIQRPSLNFARWHCYYCGRDGEVRTEGPIDLQKEAEARLRADERQKQERAERQSRALAIWDECVPVRDGDPVRRYLKARGIFELPPDAESVLRFHPRCPFGPKTRLPCMVALMRDVITDEPRAIHRTAINDGGALGRMAMGPIARAAVKLWPLEGDRLVVGEGIETVLAAVTRFPWREPLRPAWALTVAENVRWLPVIETVGHLRILVDNDASGTGQKAAQECAIRWARLDRDVIKLMPPRTGEDFNDLVMALGRR